jgi:uncharacterized lipoprotein YddW (UPF0748 family)
VDKPAYVPYYKFLDPGRPEVREFVQGTVKELASIAELAGVHLDYIRHPDAILPSGLWKKYNIVQDKVYPPYDYGYTEYERKRFQQQYGADPMNMKDPKLEAQWLQFRCDMVTGLVNDYLVPAAHAKGKQITAAVFPGPSMARNMVRQDWGVWNLDAFLPMLYNRFYDAGPEWVERQTREGVTAVKQPVYSGLFVQGMTEEVFTTTIRLARRAGASGVSLFSDGAMDDVKWKALRQLSPRRLDTRPQGRRTGFTVDKGSIPINQIRRSRVNSSETCGQPRLLFYLRCRCAHKPRRPRRARSPAQDTGTIRPL